MRKADVALGALAASLVIAGSAAALTRAGQGGVGEAYVGDDASSYQVVKSAALRFNVTPERASAGDNLRVYGWVVRPGSDYADVGAQGESLVIEFQVRGSKVFAPYTTVTIDSAGRFERRLVAVRDGSWRVRFAPESVRAGETSRSDFIDLQ